MNYCFYYKMFRQHSRCNVVYRNIALILNTLYLMSLYLHIIRIQDDSLSMHNLILYLNKVIILIQIRGKFYICQIGHFTKCLGK